ncbi:MAG: hypothetical protein WD052_01585 [Bacteroidales bacterium]
MQDNHGDYPEEVAMSPFFIGCIIDLCNKGDHLFITTGDFGRMPGYHINIIDQLGISVFETVVDAEIYELNLSDWSGRGIYFLQLIDPIGDVIDTRKILLQ